MTADTAGKFVSQHLRRSVFWAYALVLVVATHWPRLQLPDMGVERPDIFIHVGAFGTWTLLLLSTEYAGPATRRKSVVFGWIIAVVYAAIDESTQALPGVHRTAAWDDYGANVLGITLACLAFAFIIQPLLQKRTRSAEGSTPS